VAISANAISYTITWTESDVEASDEGRTYITVRPAEMEDVPDIVGLLGQYAGQGLLRSRGAREIHRMIGEFMVADEAGRPVGCVALRIHSPRLCEVASLAVDATRNGHGIGGRLIRAAVLRAHARGARRVFAFTYREHLFQQLGFRSAPVTDFPQKLARDYGGYATAVGHKAAVVLDLESPAATHIHTRTKSSAKSEIAMTDSNGQAQHSIAILGAGNLGRALAMGWTNAGYCTPQQIHITRRKADKLTYFAEAGFQVGSDNAAAVAASDVIVVAVQPQQISDLLDEIRPNIDPARHRIISVVSGVSIHQVRERLDTTAPIVRAMPNTAVSIGQSMTCLASDDPNSTIALPEAQALFDLVGQTLVITEEMMIPATALCACGIAFFLRAIRAASQGGIEIGFHAEEALLLASQTARGAASLLLNQGRHPESEIDQVTTPRGCTIAGLNEMEHKGFSSAMIKGILLSASKAEGLYRS
jgi:pyrroline-5-carboxylate reductase